MSNPKAFLAQLVEQLIRNEQVAGSNPVEGSQSNYFFSSFRILFALDLNPAVE